MKRIRLPTGKDLPSQLEVVRLQQRMRQPGLSLAQFVVAAWPLVEPSTPLVWGWHIDAICKHVEAVLQGPINNTTTTRNLLINVPPGTMKSLIVSVFAPAWVWLWWPEWRAIFASGNPRVALRDAVKCRDLVESNWYKETFATKWSLAEDQNAKGFFKTSFGGFRLSISSQSKVTGDRAHSIFVDDPIDAADARSRTARDGVNFWWDQALSNRLVSLEDGTRIVIMQRLHQEDLSGHLLESGSNWGHLCLPMEFEPDGAGAKKTFLGWKDPRKQAGELLFLARFSREVLDAERRTLGSTGYAGQHQQRPSPETGNLFKRESWRFWSSTGIQHARPRGCNYIAPRVIDPHHDKFDGVLSSWDCTFKGSDGSDYVVGVVVAFKGADRFVLARHRARMGFADTQRAIIDQRADWPKVTEVLIEDKANGSAIIETLSAVVPGVIAVEPKGGKEARAAVLEPQVEAGNWYLPEGAEWLEEWVDEFASFPLGAHDDQVDATSQAAIRISLDDDTASARALLGLR